MESEHGSVDIYDNYTNHDHLKDITPWLSPNRRCTMMAQWVVTNYSNTHYMEWNKSVQEWVKQSQIILDKHHQ